MLNIIPLSITALCIPFFTCPPPVATEPAFGVGFELTLDYATASVHFANGTFVDIARIEGGPAYRTTMRTIVPLTRAAPAMPTAEKLSGSSSYLSVIRDTFNRWRTTRDETYDPLRSIIKSLQTATEAYLQESIVYAEVALPFQAEFSFYDILHSICSSLSIKNPQWHLGASGEMAAPVVGARGKCVDDWEGPDDGPPQLILTVEATRASLTAVLLFEMCDYYEPGRELHNTTLGFDLHEDISEDKYKDIEQQLRNLTELPLTSGNGVGIYKINHLVLLGESADNPLLLEILEKVLRNKYKPGLRDVMRKDVEDRVESCSEKANLAFAGSRGIALNCLENFGYTYPRG